MDNSKKAFIIREILIFFAFILLMSPLSLLIPNKELGGQIVGGLFWFTVCLRLVAHSMAYLLLSWDMTDNDFIRSYATYLRRFHFIFRPLYYLCGAPVPYEDSTLGAGSGYQQTYEHTQDSGARSYQSSYEHQESEQERYERRKRERAQQNSYQSGHQNYSHGNAYESGDGSDSQSSYSGSSHEDRTYERDGKIYDAQGNELTWMFTILGVKYTCTYAEAEQAYKNLAKQYHPDIVAAAGPKLREKAEQEMKEINRAWDAVKKLMNQAGKR